MPWPHCNTQIVVSILRPIYPCLLCKTNPTFERWDWRVQSHRFFFMAQCCSECPSPFGSVVFSWVGWYVVACLTAGAAAAGGDGSEWTENYDEASGQTYYYNSVTGVFCGFMCVHSASRMRTSCIRRSIRRFCCICLMCASRCSLRPQGRRNGLD